jgi:hypothetical protein
METLTRIYEFMKPHWNTVALLITWLAIAFVAIRRRWHWWRKQFLTQVNFSLNYCIGNSLAMRTLMESTPLQVWSNEYGIQKIFAAAGRTTLENPFIRLANPDDQAFVNRAVLNVLSQRFGEVFIAASLGVPVRTASFCFAVTFEKYEIMRTRKLRVLIVEEQTLRNLFGPDGQADRLEINNEVYQTRLASLRAMFNQYMKDHGSSNPVLGRVELGVPANASENEISPWLTSASVLA